jgi:hypothetical protein
MQASIAAAVNHAPIDRSRLEEIVGALCSPLDHPGASRPELALWVSVRGWRAPVEARPDRFCFVGRRGKAVIRRLISLGGPGRSDFLWAGRCPFAGREARFESEIGRSNRRSRRFRPINQGGEKWAPVSRKAIHESHQLRSACRGNSSSESQELAPGDGDLFRLIFAEAGASAPDSVDNAAAGPPARRRGAAACARRSPTAARRSSVWAPPGGETAHKRPAAARPAKLGSRTSPRSLGAGGVDERARVVRGRGLARMFRLWQGRGSCGPDVGQGEIGAESRM